MYQTLTVMLALLPLTACAQELLGPTEQKQAEEAFERKPSGSSLRCDVHQAGPFLDFAFRFEAGYVLACPVRLFEGKETKLAAFIRIKPDGGKQTILAESYTIPGLPPDLRASTEIRNVTGEIGSSGMFTLGEGHYSIDFLAIDERYRVVRKHWKVKAERKRTENDVQVSLAPATVLPRLPHGWNTMPEDHSGARRVTILLDAAPVNPRFVKLRYWDRSLLLDSVNSLLRHIPSRSVKMVAFNLDQQKILYQQEGFDREGFHRLAHSLQSLQLSTVPVNVLQNTDGPLQLLSNLVNQEISSNQPPDTVIFLGPTTRMWKRIPAEYLAAADGKRKPRLYYFEYFPFWNSGAEFPDVIQRLTEDRNGTTFKVHSPGEFASALDRFRRLLDAESPIQQASAR